MTTRREYFCNVCGCTINKHAKEGEPSSGLGLLFGSNQTLTMELISRAETHICFDCVKSVQKISQMFNCTQVDA